MTPDDARLAPADLEHEYSPSSRVGGSSAPFIDDYVNRSAAAATELADRVEMIAAGTRLVAGHPERPVLVFIHGGYWQALSAEHSMYLAPRAHANGWSYAAVDYTVAPAGTVEQMVAECRTAVSAAVDRLRALGCGGPVVLAGHSAGAHLAAMATLVDDFATGDHLADEHPAALDGIRRVVLISGIFDLRPIIHTTVNDPLQLTDDRALALSPVLHPARVDATTPTDVIVAWGDNDTGAFIRQSRTYADILCQAGHRVTAIEAAHRHHFDIVDDIVDPTTPLGQLVIDGL